MIPAPCRTGTRQLQKKKLPHAFGGNIPVNMKTGKEKACKMRAFSLAGPHGRVRVMKCDIIIIGGGIAGISAAARLSAHASVVLLEAEETLGHHASGRSAAMFEREYGNRVVRALNHASEEYLTQENGGVLSPRGILMVARADQLEHFSQEMAEMSLEPLGVAEACEMVPILRREKVAAAAGNTWARDLDADRLLQDFAKRARAAGAVFHTRAPAGPIARAGGLWQVKTPQEDFVAPVIVNAAGAWVDEIACMAGVSPLGFVPLRRSIAQIPAPAGHDVRDWPMLHGACESWYAKPEAGKLLVSPSEEDPAEPHDAWADDMVLAEGLARYEEMVTAPVTRVEASWAGLRTFAPDRSPVIGFDGEAPGFFWLAGQGGYGFQTSPAASSLAADLILSRPPELETRVVAALSPERFAP